jgi:hypothetical protein
MPVDAAALEELATRAERRALKAREHATLARARAGREAAHGRIESESICRREAEAHERAARLNEQTAALYRRRVQRLVNKQHA